MKKILVCVCVLGISAHAEAGFLDFFTSSEEAAPQVQLEEATAASTTCGGGSESDASSVVPEGKYRVEDGLFRMSNFIKFDPSKYEVTSGSEPGTVIFKNNKTLVVTGYTCRGMCNSGDSCPQPTIRAGGQILSCSDKGSCSGCKPWTLYKQTASKN